MIIVIIGNIEMMGDMSYIDNFLILILILILHVRYMVTDTATTAASMLRRRFIVIDNAHYTLLLLYFFHRTIHRYPAEVSKHVHDWISSLVFLGSRQSEMYYWRMFSLIANSLLKNCKTLIEMNVGFIKYC